jgi:hypothetical protein
MGSVSCSKITDVSGNIFVPNYQGLMIRFYYLLKIKFSEITHLLI